jgi:ribonuclease P protein component
MLQAPVVARSTHFVVHHQTKALLPMPMPFKGKVVQDFSTESTPLRPQIVDNSADTASPSARILGVMVPKRHAKRSATRNLVKRQVRAAMHSEPGLAGAWLVRLRQPIDPQRFPSAASEALRAVLHAELLVVMAQVRAARVAAQKAPA